MSKQLSMMEILGPPDVRAEPEQMHRKPADDSLRLICRVCLSKRDHEGNWDPDYDAVIIDSMGNFEYHIGFIEWQLANKFPNHLWLDEWPAGNSKRDKDKQKELKSKMSAYWFVEKAVAKGQGSYNFKGEEIL